MKKLLIVIIIILGLFLLLGSSCTSVKCPTYTSNYNAKEQKRKEKKGDEMGVCAYKKSITKKERRRANKIWNSDFCKVKPKKRN